MPCPSRLRRRSRVFGLLVAAREGCFCVGPTNTASPAGAARIPLPDVLAVRGSWEHFRQISLDPNFNALTPIESEETDPSKCITAALCFAGAIGL